MAKRRSGAASYNRRKEEEIKRNKQIVEDIRSGMNKADVATKYRLKFNQVCRIWQEYGKDLEELVDNLDEKEEIKEENVLNRDKVQSNSPKAKISDDKVQRILAMYKSNVPVKQIAEEVGVNQSTVYNWVKREGVEFRRPRKSTSRNTVETPPSKEIIKKDKFDDIPEAVTISFENTSKKVEAGLIADRHDMPCNKYIFQQSLSSAQMFNYNELDKIVTEFVRSNITFMADDNGDMYGIETLVIYVTGMTCCLASLIKICERYKVNLVLKHYNNSTGGYQEQVIWRDFGVSKAQSMFYQASEIVLLGGCKLDDFKPGLHYYATKVIDFNDTSRLPGRRHCVEYLSLEKGETWVKHVKESYDIINDNTGSRKAIYYQENEIDPSGHESLVRLISKTSNFKFYK